LTIPALLLAGLDPVSAIATNKLQGAAATLSATAAFARQRLIDWRSAAPVAITAGLGSVVGAFCVSLVSRSVLEGLVPVLLMAVAVYFAVGRRMREEDAHARVSPLVFVGAVAPAIGFYDGMFGPGGGSFYMLGFVGLLGYGVLRATAHTKLANAASGLGSLGVYNSDRRGRLACRIGYGAWSRAGRPSRIASGHPPWGPADPPSAGCGLLRLDHSAAAGTE